MALFKDMFRNGLLGKTNFSKTRTFSHIFSEVESFFCLFFFAYQIGKKFFNNLLSLNVRTLKAVHSSLSSSIRLFINNHSSSIEEGFEGFDGSWVSHANGQVKSVCMRLTGTSNVVWTASDDIDASFSIKESSKILDCNDTDRHTIQSTLVILNKQANSEKLQNGQLRAKLGESQGVCNEHVLALKRMMCSELYRNIESLTEMFRLAFVSR